MVWSVEVLSSPGLPAQDTLQTQLYNDLILLLVKGLMRIQHGQKFTKCDKHLKMARKYTSKKVGEKKNR